jgi:hypothetical protein
MIKNNRNNEQIYGRNDMIMLDPNNKIYGSLGLADKYVMKTEEGTRLMLSNPKLGSFANVLTEFNMYGWSEQKQYKGINLFPPNTRYSDFVEVSIPKGSNVFWATDGTPATGGNFKFFNEDKTENNLFGVDKGSTSKRHILTIDAKYIQNLLADFDQSKICLGVGTKPIYEPYVGGKPSPSPDYSQEIKSVVNPTVKVTNEDGTKSQTVTLPYTLNAIPVTSGGNVTIDGKQYIADYVDVERGKLVRMCKEIDFTKVKQSTYSNLLTNTKEARYSYDNNNIKPLLESVTYNTGSGFITRAIFIGRTTWNNDTLAIAAHGQAYGEQLSIRIPVNKDAIEYFTSIGGCKGIFQIETPEEIDLMPEQIQAYKSLSTNYPLTIIENNYNTWMKATYKSTESV